MLKNVLGNIDLLGNLDLVIAGSILLIAMLVFFLVHIHALPVKTIPYIIGSLLALIGVEVFKAYRASRLNKQIELQKAEIDKRRQEIDRLQKDAAISAQQYHEAKSKLDEYEAAYRKTSLLLEEQDADRRRAIENMTLDETIKALGGGKVVPMIPPAPGGG